MKSVVDDNGILTAIYDLYVVYYRDLDGNLIFRGDLDDRDSALSFAEDLRHRLILDGVSFSSVVVVRETTSSCLVHEISAKPIRLKDFQKDWETFKQNSHFV